MTETLELLTLALIPGFILLDLVWRKRRYDAPRFWRLRALAVTVGIFFFTTEVAIFWGIALEGVSLLDGSALGTAGGAVVGILVYELAHYWYHRAAHQWNWLWRAGHQMHHSAESVDAFGAYYLHPFDAFMFTTLGSLVFFPLLGVSVEAGVIAALFLTFNAMFQHANIPTPHWLGYLIQRPESHAVHHGRGIHRYNYSDLPLWDMVFGTFRNPRSVEGLEAGFYKGASSRIVAMLTGRDVSRPKREDPALPGRTVEAQAQ
ncbi:MAG: sterol desaturase family protein [Pseudomonadota bacterium]|nr:MAG: sterol desaturase family protein [Pseudomonadota bacterium]